MVRTRIRRAAARAWLPILICLALPPAAAAVPADPEQRLELEQPSGDSFTARPFGDEWYNGRETASGFTILRNPRSGAWEYAEKAPGGRLRRSGRVVGQQSPAGIARHLRDPDQAARAEELREAQHEPGPLAGPVEAPSLDAAGPLNSGAHPSLVILVEFADQASLGTTPADWHNRFFGPSDSLSDYYDEVSFGNLAIGPAAETHGTANDGVVGWLTLPTNHPNTQGRTDSRNQQLVADAISAANAYVDFASYDTDHSGWISDDELHITVIPAGWEASAQCGSPAVWGHRWGTTAAVADGVFAGVAYTQFGEKHCDQPGTVGARPDRMATLGIIAHEIGHDLDLPDLYDTDSSSYGGVGYWSVMATGSWLNLPNTDPGSSPPHLDAFSKAYQGWLTPTVAAAGSTNALLEAAANPAALQVRDNPSGVDWLFRSRSGTGEYFLVENRQRTGYDRAVPGCGLLIWHIDETRSYESPNATDSARLVDLEEADADNVPFEAADTFVGGRTFDATSTPNSNLNDGTPSGVSLSNFSSTCGPSMSVGLLGAATGSPPSGTDNSVTTNEDTIRPFVAADFGFSDPDGHTFDTVRIDTLPGAGVLRSNGVAVIAGQTYAPGTLAFAPALNGCAEPYASFAFTVRDSSGTYDPSPNTMRIDVTCVDDIPAAVNDSISLDEDAGATAVDVLANDTDTDGGPKAVSFTTSAANGTVAVTGGGTGVSYTPDANYCGPDSFMYALNGGWSATVTVTVTCIDDPPAAAADSATVGEDSSATALGVLGNDTDPDGGTKVIQSTGTAAHGTVTVTSDNLDVTYQPAANYCGPDEFTYTLNGGSTATVSVTVTCVDDPPTAVDDTHGVLEDSGAAAVDVLANDTDDGGAKMITGATDALHGAVVVTGGGTGLTYAPDPDYCGGDSFDYTITGGDTATVTVTVSCLDDAPTAGDDSKTVHEDSGATPVNVLANDSNADGGTMEVELTSGASDGTVAIAGDGAGVTYTPDADYCGPDSFTYTLNGGSTATVVLTVTCVDDPAVAADDSRSLDEDASATALDVLTNDSDLDGPAPAIDSKTDAANGTVAITSAGANLTYAPDANHCGSDSFTYTLVGGSTATVTMTVTCVDDAPVAENDSATVAEDAPTTPIDVLVNDTDADGDTPVIQDRANGAHGSVAITNTGAGVSYTPDLNYCGPDSFTYTLNGGDTATVSVTMTCVDDLPVAADDSKTVAEDSGATSLNVRGNDTDVENDAITVTNVGEAAHGDLAIVSGDVTYTPDSNYCGPDGFTYTVNGGETAVVTLDVTCVNDPSIAVDDSRTVAQDSGATTIDVRGNDTDVDGGVELVASKTNPTHGAVAITNDGADLTYTPATGYCGPDGFTYTLAGGDTATVTITVTCNTPPVAVDDSKTVGEDSGTTTFDVLGNDTDTDGGDKTIESKTNGARGTVAITNAGAGVSYTPDPNYCGPDSFTYTLNGGDTATVTVTVTCVDDLPVAADDSKTVAEDSGATILNVRSNDTDVENDAITVTAVGEAAHGTVALDAGGDVAYTPDLNHCGPDEFTYTVNGGDTATVTLDLTCVDDPPLAENDTEAVAEDSGPTTFTVRANDGDHDDGPKTITAVGPAAHGTVVRALDGTTVSYTPDLNYCGPDSFEYTLNGGDTATVTVTVTCADDAPTAVNDSKTVEEDSGATAVGVLSNDTDIDIDIDLGLKTVTDRTNGLNGQVAITNAGADVTYTPDANWCGDDSFTYTLNGGSTGTVTVTVTCVDDLPVAADDAKTVDEDAGATSLNVRGNDTDVENDAITVTNVGEPSHGDAAIASGDVTYTPDANYCGPDEFTYTVNGGATGTVSVTVTCVDDASVAVDDSRPVGENSDATTIDVRTNDTDIDDGQAEAIDSKTNGAHGTVAITNAGADLTYTPVANYCGADSFTYTLAGGDTATVTITVECAPTPPAPAVAADDSRTVGEDSGVTTIDVLANDTNADAVASRTNGAHGAVAIVGDDVIYTPAANYCGADSFTYTVDGGSSATVRVTVNCVDDAPVAVDDAAGVAEDNWLVVDVRANDTDVDDGAKAIDSRTNGAHGATMVTDDGNIAYRPDANYCGTDSFTYTLNGGSPATVSVLVTCVAEPGPPADRKPPETTIPRGPKKKVRTKRRRAKVVFKFASTEPGSIFYCKLDKAEFEKCDAKMIYKLKRGRHALHVLAVDAAGNPDMTPASRRTKVVRKKRRR